MKSFLSLLSFSIFLFVSLALNAQVPKLTDKKWIVAEYGISDNIRYGLDPQIKPLVVFFNKDSAHNKVDYSNIEMHFSSDGTYEAKNVIGTKYDGTWSLNVANDSLTTDTLKYKFNFINEFNCITNNGTEQVVDSIGTKETFYSYIKLFGMPDITAISEQPSSTLVKVYPIPVKETLTVDLLSKNVKEARLYNIFGQLLRTVAVQNTSTFQINMQELPAGYYSLELITNTGERVVKKAMKE